MKGFEKHPVKLRISQGIPAKGPCNPEMKCTLAFSCLCKRKTQNPKPPAASPDLPANSDFVGRTPPGAARCDEVLGKGPLNGILGR